MFSTLIVWAISSAVVFVGVLFGRTSRLQRRLRVADLDWKAVLVLAILAGAVPAFVYDQLNQRAVEVPPTSGQPVIPK